MSEVPLLISIHLSNNDQHKAMAEKIYWKGIEEKEQSEGFRQLAEKEFRDELPVLSSITEPISTGNSNRRDFLKMLGFSVTAGS